MQFDVQVSTDFHLNSMWEIGGCGNHRDPVMSHTHFSCVIERNIPRFANLSKLWLRLALKILQRCVVVCFLGSRCYYSIQRTLLAFHYILSVANSQHDKLPIDLIAQVTGGRRVFIRYCCCCSWWWVVFFSRVMLIHFDTYSVFYWRIIYEAIARSACKGWAIRRLPRFFLANLRLDFPSFWWLGDN